MRQRVIRAIGRALSYPPALHASASFIDLVAPIARGDRKEHILVCPPGGGNIGDQAMVEAFIANVVGPVCLVTRDSSDFNLDHLTPSDDVRTVALPNLLYGRMPRFVRDHLRWRKLLNTAASVSIVGADIMDGAYNSSASSNRSNLATRTSRQGFDTRVLGFSWNASPSDRARRAVVRASRCGVKLMVRDPLSLQRIKDHGAVEATLVADTVFASSTTAQAVAELDSPPEKLNYVVVNASALVARSQSQSDAYHGLIEELRSLGYGVVLLPHVLRGARDNDLTACREVYSRWTHDASVRLIERELHPDEVRTVAGNAAFVVTGRMHLAVMALSRVRPAVVVATQGKVEGLMRYFQLSDFAISPGSQLGSDLRNAVSTLHEELEQQQLKVETLLPEVRQLASLNFDGLRDTSA